MCFPPRTPPGKTTITTIRIMKREVWNKRQKERKTAVIWRHGSLLMMSRDLTLLGIRPENPTASNQHHQKVISLQTRRLARGKALRASPARNRWRKTPSSPLSRLRIEKKMATEERTVSAWPQTIQPMAMLWIQMRKRKWTFMVPAGPNWGNRSIRIKGKPSRNAIVCLAIRLVISHSCNERMKEEICIGLTLLVSIGGHLNIRPISKFFCHTGVRSHSTSQYTDSGQTSFSTVLYT